MPNWIALEPTLVIDSGRATTADVISEMGVLEMRTQAVRTLTVVALSAFAFVLFVGAALGQIIDASQCYYVPEAGPVATPLTGLAALRYFRLCPNNDGTQSLGNNARIRIVIRYSDGTPVVGLPATDIAALFNGGTPAQGFTGVGSDSIIANSQWNPTCPDMFISGSPTRGIPADAATDQTGSTYMTFTGITPGSPGVGTRDSGRKWGHYDTLIPVFAGGNLIQGRLDMTSPPGSFALEIKNLDNTGGLALVVGDGEKVNSLDISPVQAAIGGAYKYWYDFDWSGVVNTIDLNFVKAHNSHNCTSPLNP